MTIYLLIGIAVIGAFVFFRSKKAAANINNIDTVELKSLLQKGEITLIDVRTTQEVNQGTIGKPLHIELGPNIKNEFAKLDKNKKYVVYCRSGRRSAMACNIMNQLGFSNVSNLTGGINSWK